MNKVQIIGGNWRRRQLAFPATATIRPTPAKIRETLFNWLQNYIVGSVCLDLFAGSGALGFEAASRGAKSALLVEKDRATCTALRTAARKLCASQVQINHSSAGDFLQSPPLPLDIVFIDPPFAGNLLATTCQQLENNGWLQPKTLLYLETAKLDPPNTPSNWHNLKHKRAGQVASYLFQRQ